ncbi:MAG: hypothetical protein H6737_24060 [Alphaproteobacteria bacterium]|nr:hypothetical protein [Alphaproteobacteria bacterium]
MTPVLVSLVGGHWALNAPAPRVEITAGQVCIAGDCAATGKPAVDAEGRWTFDSGVQLRWRTNVSAEVSLDGRTWSPATLSFTTPSESAPVGLEVLASSHASPAPGRWTKETAKCDRAIPVWVFSPIVGDEPMLAAYPTEGGGWRVRSGARVVMCHDAEGQFGGVP